MRLFLIGVAVVVSAACDASHAPGDGGDDASGDAGSTMDGGSAGSDDAGDPPVDAVAPAPDAGPPPVDAGPAPADAGPMCEGDAVLCDGVCVEVDSDPSHCGACGAACELPHAAVGCAAGECVVTECDEGWGDCDGDAANGCEQDLLFTDASCGACDIACGPTTELCWAGACQPTGESCDSRVVLDDGRNVLRWRATELDHPPRLECNPRRLEYDRDIVGVYVASVTGYVRVSVPDSDRAHMLIDVREACTSGGLACDERDPILGPPSVWFHATAGAEYSVLLYSTGPVPDPLVVDVDPLDCDDSATGYPVEPGTGTIVDSVWAKEHWIAFDRPLRDAGGSYQAVLTIRGSAGTSDFFDGRLTPEDRTTVRAREPNPAIRLQPGERITVTAEFPGLVDDYCGNPVPPVSWYYDVVSPPCLPGVDGVLGSSGEYVELYPWFGPGLHIAADSEADGWFYLFHDYAPELVRVDEVDGTIYEDVPAMGGPPVFVGPELYVTSATGLWRISQDAGETFADEHYASLDAVDVGFPAARGDDIYFTTEATSAGVDIWRVPAGQTPPVAPTLVRTVPGESACRGLALDDRAYFLSCGTHRLVRVDRVTGAKTLVSDEFELYGGAVVAHDTGGDGSADVLYGTGDRSIFYVCEPHYLDPYADHVWWYGVFVSHRALVLDETVPRLWIPGSTGLALDMR